MKLHSRRKLRVEWLWMISLAAMLGLPSLCWSQFQEPVLTNVVSGLGSDWGATFSSDMLEVYWVADPLDGREDFDVWSAHRVSIDAPWQDPQPLEIVNSTRLENMPHLSYDGLTLTFSSFGREGGYGGLDLWQTKRESRNAPWQEPVNMGPTINTRGGDGGPTFSADGLELIYTTGCAVPLNTNCLLSTMRRSTRASVDDDWSPPERMTPSARGDQLGSVSSPSLSIDGLSLYYSALGSNGATDVYVSKRPTRDSLFGAKENLGEPINTRRSDTVVRIAADGSLHYTRDWIRGQHGLRIWRAEAESTLPGDANLDGEVSFADFLVLSDNFGRAGDWSKGDFDFNGKVEFSDFLLLSDNFGKMSPNIAAVPEPNVLMMVWLGRFGLIAFRRHHPPCHRGRYLSRRHEDELN